MTRPASAPAMADLHQLLDDLVNEVPGTEVAVVLSTDGLPLAASRGVTRDTGELVAAAAAGLHALAVVAGAEIHNGRTLRTIVEMEHVLLAIEPAGDSAVLAVAFSGAPDPASVNGPVTAAANRAAKALAAVHAARRANLPAGESAPKAGRHARADDDPEPESPAGRHAFAAG
ncbi:roadblock/LC7 domain-containing protein [Dactylosporangium sp. AC04546]|uniref:roadblock/LC7 domain-containing protein n=1 Tax=Dactylosporangium sp. AC04546 TaxID=2862460 RepID=UPI001EDD86BC|nr:roadblock/LC7 domain-containing protein [Dactylosporangium sp. AC04546]WVK87891.1 roadblock/LC7 domain-containing protein [Dactylosporangium sp. AC04546]